jgi:AraC family transcriptional regulator, regulatory protein of adaptative response / methylated-DNA-[protein]-cysteine methyltransferase
MTMREIIRLAFGNSSLGDFMVAMSDNGIVAVEFGSMPAAMQDALQARLPEAKLVPSDDLAPVMEILTDLIDDPAMVCALPLDLRGTPYQMQVWQMLRDIPAGQTTSYGALAARLGTRDARDVTTAIAGNPVAVMVPCHRVIKKDGSISGYRWGVRRKRALLAREQRVATQRDVEVRRA